MEGTDKVALGDVKLLGADAVAGDPRQLIANHVVERVADFGRGGTRADHQHAGVGEQRAVAVDRVGEAALFVYLLEQA